MRKWLWEQRSSIMILICMLLHHRHSRWENNVMRRWLSKKRIFPVLHTRNTPLFLFYFLSFIFIIYSERCLCMGLESIYLIRRCMYNMIVLHWIFHRGGRTRLLLFEKMNTLHVMWELCRWEIPRSTPISTEEPEKWQFCYVYPISFCCNKGAVVLSEFV